MWQETKKRDKFQIPSRHDQIECISEGRIGENKNKNAFWGGERKSCGFYTKKMGGEEFWAILDIFKNNKK